MHAEEVPLKIHTDICRGIATCYTRPFIVPTQEAYWHLPWDCYLLHDFIHCAHSRGILILAVELLPITHAHSMPHSSSTTVTCVPSPWTFTLVVIVTCSGLKPTSAHSRDNTVKLSWASHLYCLIWIYIINIFVFVISYNITPAHKYCLHIHHWVATHLVRHTNSLLLLLLKKVGSAKLRENDIHPISPKTPAIQYQTIDRKKRNAISCNEIQWHAMACNAMTCN